tara:strand:+ start:242 stop:502 length:261 start_codon:yes stop_codon:yes gene_type:complete
MKTINFEEVVIPKLLKKWERLQRQYYNMFAVSSLAKYYKIIFEEEPEWEKDKIVNSLIADELKDRKEETIDELQFEIEMVVNNLNK